VGRAAHGVGAVQAQREVGGGESSTRRGCGASTEGGGWWGEQHTAWVRCKHRGRWVVGRAAHGVGAVQAQREVGAYASRRATASFAGLHTPITAAGKPPG
jgi:hypothetical protein